MQFMLQSCRILPATIVGWANERQQQIIEFQNDQIEALLKKLGKKRLLLTDDQRRVLAVKRRALGWKALLEFCCCGWERSPLLATKSTSCTVECSATCPVRALTPFITPVSLPRRWPSDSLTACRWSRCGGCLDDSVEVQLTS